MELIADTLKQHKLSPESVAKRLAPISLATLMDTKYEPLQWLVSDLIPVGSLAAISGVQGTCKTWLMLELCLAVASGKPFLGHFPTIQKPVLYIDQENGDRRLSRRMRLLGADKSLPFDVMSKKGFRLVDQYTDFAVRYCKTHGIGLVILDSLTRMHALQENSATEMSTLYDQLDKFLSIGVAVFIIHHNRKPAPNQRYTGGSQEMRGSSDIPAFLDTHLTIQMEGDIVKVVVAKMRDEEAIKPFAIKKVSSPGSISFDYTGSVVEKKIESASRLIVDLLTSYQPMSQKEIIESLHQEIGEDNSKDALRKLAKEGVITEQRVKKSKQYTLTKPGKNSLPIDSGVLPGMQEGI